MQSSFDRRVLGDSALEFVRACQRKVCHDAVDHRALVHELVGLATQCSGELRVQRDGGAFVRAELQPSANQSGFPLGSTAVPPEHLVFTSAVSVAAPG